MAFHHVLRRVKSRFCVASAILLLHFPKMCCIFRGRRSTLDISDFILRGKRSSLDVSCCMLFANRNVCAAQGANSVAGVAFGDMS